MSTALISTPLSDWKDLATILGAILGLATLIRGLVEYAKQGAQKRAELFTATHKRFKENQALDNITELLEVSNPAIANVPFRERIAYLTFFEEVALLIKSRLIRKEVAHYMLGYYAIRCWENDNFWKGINRQGEYWALFRSFTEEMKVIEARKPFSVSCFRF